MMIFARFEQSDSLAEHTDTDAPDVTITLGETWTQLTYDLLRYGIGGDGGEGNDAAAYVEGVWRVEGHAGAYSDVVIYVAEVPE